MEILLAPAIFLLTLLLVLARPWGIGIGWSAWLGAGLALVSGLISPEDILYIARLVWDATLAFVFLIFISIILDRAGFFEWFALKAIHMGGGKGMYLFLSLMLPGALISAIFANDGSALMLTPIIYSKIKHLNLPRRHILPYIMGAGFISDTASLPLVISNLTNIITAHYFRISFWEYALYMFLPNLVSLGLSLLVLYLFYRRDLIRTYEKEVVQSLPPGYAIRDGFIFRMGFVVTGLLGLAFLCLELLRIEVPVSVVLGGCALLLALSTFKNKEVRLKEVFLFTPWNIVFFSIGMYAVVYSFKRVGYTDSISWIIRELSDYGELIAILGTGLLSASLSAVMNNLPTVMTMNIAISEAGLSEELTRALALANIVGTNIGPKLTPIGSLATLLWLHVLRHRGIHIGWWYYMKVGFVLTPPVLLGTLFSLWLSLWLLGRV
jgi:arsenical pump membrane protein